MSLNSKLTAEIDHLFEKVKEQGGTMSRADFGKLYEPTQTTDTAAMFERLGKVREINAAKNDSMSFTVTPSTTNLTSEQQAAYQKERNILEGKVTEPVKLSATSLMNDPRLGNKVAINEAHAAEMIAEFESKKGKPVKPSNHISTLVDEALRLRGWI